MSMTTASLLNSEHLQFPLRRVAAAAENMPRIEVLVLWSLAKKGRGPVEA